MPRFVLQWHLTVECEQKCQHCYMYDSPTFITEKNNMLSFNDCTKILDDFISFCNKLKATPFISFTGGDPFLRDDFFKILEETASRGIRFNILGNPHLLDNSIVKILKRYKITNYQMSLDGLEETHDLIRGKGSFNKTLMAFELLRTNDIQSVCMFTLSKANSKDLIPLIHFINNKVSLFDFARYVPIKKDPSGLDVNDNFSPSEYHQILFDILDTYRILLNSSKTRFGRKENLWNLLYDELGLLMPQSTNRIVDGCGMGIRHLSILSDGNVLACRRMPVYVGKVPDEKLINVFLKSEGLNEIRDVENLEKCSKCNLVNSCRGCPAVAYAYSGSLFKQDPHCWKEV